MIDSDVLAVLRAYPQIYFACHVEHRSRERSNYGLTSREAGILAHVADLDGGNAARLARHLGVAPSTLSAALARLETLEMVETRADPADARRRIIALTPRGREALAADSVLDADRVAALLDRMDPASRRRAVEGLALLAGAARQFRERGGEE